MGVVHPALPRGGVEDAERSSRPLLRRVAAQDAAQLGPAHLDDGVVAHTHLRCGPPQAGRAAGHPYLVVALADRVDARDLVGLAMADEDVLHPRFAHHVDVLADVRNVESDPDGRQPEVHGVVGVGDADHGERGLLQCCQVRLLAQEHQHPAVQLLQHRQPHLQLVQGLRRPAEVDEHLRAHQRDLRRGCRHHVLRVQLAARRDPVEEAPARPADRQQGVDAGSDEQGEDRACVGSHEATEERRGRDGDQQRQAQRRHRGRLLHLCDREVAGADLRHLELRRLTVDEDHEGAGENHEEHQQGSPADLTVGHAEPGEQQQQGELADHRTLGQAEIGPLEESLHQDKPVGDQVDQQADQCADQEQWTGAEGRATDHAEHTDTHKTEQGQRLPATQPDGVGAPEPLVVRAGHPTHPECQRLRTHGPPDRHRRPRGLR